MAASDRTHLLTGSSASNTSYNYNTVNTPSLVTQDPSTLTPSQVAALQEQIRSLNLLLLQQQTVLSALAPQLQTNPVVTIETDLGTYTGEVNGEGKPHGRGTLLYKPSDTRDKYEGIFVDGMRDGVGILIFRNHDRLEGEFQRDKVHGRAKRTWTEGDHPGTYDGDWVDDKMEGQGIRVWSNDNSVYKGTFKNGSTFKGVLTRNNQTFTGEWKDNKFDNGTHRYFVNGNWETLEYRNGQQYRESCCTIL